MTNAPHPFASAGSLRLLDPSAGTCRRPDLEALERRAASNPSGSSPISAPTQQIHPLPRLGLHGVRSGW